MKIKLKIGDEVVVPVSLNKVWAGRGIIKDIYNESSSYKPCGTALVQMKTGRQQGEEGGFNIDKLTLYRERDLIEEVVDELAPMHEPSTATPSTVMVIRNIIREALSTYERKSTSSAI